MSDSYEYRSRMTGQRIVLDRTYSVCTRCLRLFVTQLRQMDDSEQTIRNQPQCPKCRGDS